MGIGPAVAIPMLLDYTGVSKEETQRYEEQYAGVNFNYRTDMDDMDVPIHAMRAKHTPKKPYIGEFWFDGNM